MTSGDQIEHSVLDAVKSRQFGYWMVLFLPAFIVLSVAVEMYSLSPNWAFVVGVVFMGIFDHVCNWLTDWYVLSKEVEADSV